MNTRLKLYLLCITTGILMGISWPFTGSLTPLMFVGFVPMLVAESVISSKMLRPRRLLLPAFTGFLVFNIITTWWIYHATAEGMIMGLTLIAWFMTGVFYLFHVIHRRLGNFYGYAAFVTMWMAYEFGHYYWEISWPWLNLGNVFSVRTTWVQWYEYTGIGGGTLWVLLANVFFFLAYKEYSHKNSFSRKAINRCSIGLLTVLIPIGISQLIFNSYEEKKDPIDVVVVQPNIDPYANKFRGMNAVDQLSIFFRNAYRAADTTAEFILGPETVLPYDIIEDSIERQLHAPINEEYFANEFDYIKRIFTLMKRTEMVLGMSSVKFFNYSKELPGNARPYRDGISYVAYNSSLYIEPALSFDIYHKKFLVLGVEKIPFAHLIPALNDLALSLGGSPRTLGASLEPKVTKSRFTKAVFTTAICYESIYSYHMAQAVRKGANVIFIMTNDGWWHDTPGYKQHFSYARLRAIELRRSIARSANTGISGFIDQRGQIIKSTGWWKSTAIRHSINLNNDLTFYARTGDALYTIALLLTMGIVVVWLYCAIRGITAGKTKEI